MARANLIALVGALLSTISVGFLWFAELFAYLSFSSNDTELTITINELLSGVSALFIIGSIMAFGTQLGVVFELPGLVFVPFLIWHSGGAPAYVLAGYVFALTGAVFLVHSFFAQITVPGLWLRIPPESRFRVWFPWKDERNPRRMLKRDFRIASLSFLIILVALSTILASAYVRPESKIQLWVVIADDIYGAVDLKVSLDGDTIVDTRIEANPLADITEYSQSIQCRAGSHQLSVDVMSQTYPEANNRVEYYNTEKVLPFSTEFVQVGIGVGFM